MFDIDFEQLFFRIKLVSAILSFAFFALSVHFFLKFRKLVIEKIRLAKLALKTPVTKTESGGWSRWEEVLRHLDSQREAEWKFAVIEADKLADDALKSAGFFGETMGDRLTNIDKSQLVNIEGLWEAHKIRNKLVHDVNYFLRYAEARRAVQLFEKALKELGAI